MIHPVVQQHIDTGDAQPVFQQPYRARHNLTINKLWAAPVVLVRKKNGSERFCVDYRKLSSVIRRDSHPIPHVQNTLDCLHGTSDFSSIDLRSGYWQVEVDDESKAKTAFAIHDGLFEFRKMPFVSPTLPPHSIPFDDHLTHLNDVFSRPILNLNLVSVSLLVTVSVLIQIKSRRLKNFQSRVVLKTSPAFLA